MEKKPVEKKVEKEIPEKKPNMTLNQQEIEELSEEELSTIAGGVNGIDPTNTFIRSP